MSIIVRQEGIESKDFRRAFFGNDEALYRNLQNVNIDSDFRALKEQYLAIQNVITDTFQRSGGEYRFLSILHGMEQEILLHRESIVMLVKEKV